MNFIKFVYLKKKKIQKILVTRRYTAYVKYYFMKYKIYVFTVCVK